MKMESEQREAVQIYTRRSYYLHNLKSLVSARVLLAICLFVITFALWGSDDLSSKDDCQGNCPKVETKTEIAEESSGLQEYVEPQLTSSAPSSHLSAIFENEPPSESHLNEAAEDTEHESQGTAPDDRLRVETEDGSTAKYDTLKDSLQPSVENEDNTQKHENRGDEIIFENVASPTSETRTDAPSNYVPARGAIVPSSETITVLDPNATEQMDLQRVEEDSTDEILAANSTFLEGLDSSFERENLSTSSHDLFVPFLPGTLGAQMLRYKGQLPHLNVTVMDLLDHSRGDGFVKSDSGKHIITTFFRGTYHVDRFREILSTLISNLENPYIEAVHVLWEQTDPRYFIPAKISRQLVDKGLHKKLVLKEVTKQPTYRTMFHYANTQLRRGAIAIVTNADIYYDASIKCVSTPPFATVGNANKTIPRVALALSRRKSGLCSQKINRMDPCEKYIFSHDAFVFAPPIPSRIELNCDHTQNQGYGAENIVIYEFKHANFEVVNPCLTVKGFHLHCVSERHYFLHFINRDPPRPGGAFPVRRKCEQIVVY